MTEQEMFDRAVEISYNYRKKYGSDMIDPPAEWAKTFAEIKSHGNEFINYLATHGEWEDEVKRRLAEEGAK